jgi:hypothetical protein
MDILLVSSVQERISHKAISLFTASTCLKKVALSQITLHLIPLQAIQGISALIRGLLRPASLLEAPGGHR